jgi:hypothetical protein
MFNFKNTQFCLDLFWNMMETQSKPHPNENNFYCFHKRGEDYYVQAYNEYDLMIKLHKNNILTDSTIYEDLSSDIDDPEKTFDTEEELYKYFVNEYVRFYRELYKYYYEKLDVIL